MKIYDWRELYLQSMDLILCSGNSNISNSIKWFQRLAGADEDEAELSHVAGVYKTWRCGCLYVQESTSLNEWSDEEGVQINEFQEWLYNYNGKVYVRQLGFDRTHGFFYDDWDFWLEHMNDDYESGIMGALELFLCALRLHRFIPFYDPLGTKNPHCTELIAKRLRVHKWVRTVNVNRVPPYFWKRRIDKFFNCPIGELKRIK